MQSSDKIFKNVPQDIGKVRLVLIKTPNFKPVYLPSALSDCDAVSFIWKYVSGPTFGG